MKKTIILLILFAACSQLKAQQLNLGQPNTGLSNGLNNYFKPQVTDPKSLLQSNSGFVNKLNPDNSNAIIMYSRMPVVKVSSNDHMPVSVPAQQGEKYTMLVQKVIVNPAKPVETATP